MENVLNFKGGEQIKNIIKIQNTYRIFQFNKKQKELLLSKLTYKNQPAPLIRIRQNNFQSLINKKIRNLLKEIIKIDSLDYYNIDNFLETFDNLNFDHSKIHNNMKKKRIFKIIIIIFYTNLLRTIYLCKINREVAEWLKAHAWKAC